ncbi:TPA: hypothetical protein ACX6RS_003922 [Photobacterium damselae]
MREHNKLSLKPYITATPKYSGINKDDGIFITNNGMGPAFVKAASIEVNGKAFDLMHNSWPEISEYLNLKNTCFIESWFRKDSAIKSGESIRILGPTLGKKDADCPIQLMKMLSSEELILKLKYNSIYEDEFYVKQHISFDKNVADSFRNYWFNVDL